jgi:hypothetical protein
MCVFACLHSKLDLQKVLIRNIKPSSPLYSFSELMLHAKELINEESLNAVTDEWGHELGIKHCMERILIDTRTIALESIRQGLTLNGKSKTTGLCCSWLFVSCPSSFLTLFLDDGVLL